MLSGSTDNTNTLPLLDLSMLVGISPAGPSGKLIVEVPVNTVELFSVFCVVLFTIDSIGHDR
jgi:hypothetical protein